jgi:hypothetical protein
MDIRSRRDNVARALPALACAFRASAVVPLVI